MKLSKLIALVAALCLIALMGGSAFAAGVAQQPVICNRACWGSRSTPYHPFGTTGTFNRVTIHHTANVNDFSVTSIEGSKSRLRATQNYHMDSLGWSDIGYHFLVDKFGNTFEGLNGSLASTNARGAHDAINASSLGVCMLGWFDSGYNGDTPAAQRAAAYSVAAWRVPDPFTGFGSSSYGGYSNIGYVLGHYQVSSKTCPGTFNQPRIGTNFTGGEMRLEINSRITGGPWAAQYVSNTFPAQVEAGALVTVSVTFKNVGTNTWNSSTKLGTSNQRDRSSVFYNSADWGGANRPTSVDQASVAPGANGTFTFIAKAPTTTGSYQESFEVLQEGVTWFPGTGDDVIWYVDVVAPPAYRAQYVSNTFPSSVVANSLVTTSVTFKNTGANAWNSNTRLGTSNQRDRSSAFFNSADWLAANRVTAADGSNVAVGANGVFTFIAKAPATAGNYTEAFELLQEGVQWFAGTGDDVTWIVSVTAPTPTPSPTPSPTPTPTPSPTATPSPTPAIADIIIDNTSANITWTGSWLTASSAAGRYGADYRYANSGTGAEASYRFNPTTPGTYNISVWYPAGTNRANNAPHRVDHFSGATSYSVNQQINGGTWVSLGNHYFNTVGYVVVRTTGANPTVVMADAVKVTYVGP